MNLGILFGGNSVEHEISIVTAYSLKKRLMLRYDISMLYIDFDNNLFIADKMSFDDFKNNNYKKLKKTNFINGGIKKRKIDCMIISTHGENSEDGICAALCRYYNISYVGSNLLASSISMDKFATYNYLKGFDINLIDTYKYDYDDYINDIKLNIFPCIIKPRHGGSSIGINICKNDNEFFEKIIDSLSIEKELIIQPFINEISEYNMAFYHNGNSRLERIDSKDEFFSFNNKYNESFKIMHQSIMDKELEQRFVDVGRRVYAALECKGIIRIDFFLIDNEIYINEINTIPGALAMYLFDDFDKAIDSCINSAILDKSYKYSKGNFLTKSTISK